MDNVETRDGAQYFQCEIIRSEKGRCQVGSDNWPCAVNGNENARDRDAILSAVDLTLAAKEIMTVIKEVRAVRGMAAMSNIAGNLEVFKTCSSGSPAEPSLGDFVSKFRVIHNIPLRV